MKELHSQAAEGVPLAFSRASPANIRTEVAAVRESRLRLCGPTVRRLRLTVDTKMVTPRDQFYIMYRLVPEGDNWLATAITVEDVSLTANLGQSDQRSPGSNDSRRPADADAPQVRQHHWGGIDVKTLAVMLKDLRLISRDHFGLVALLVVR